MSSTYMVIRKMILEDQNGDPIKIIQKDKLFEGSYEDAWNYFRDVRQNYIFRWTERSASILSIVKKES